MKEDEFEIKLSKKDKEDLKLKLLLEEYDVYFRNLAMGRYAYILNYLSLEDLMEDAFYVLVTSLRGFDETKRASFKTYVTLCVTRSWKKLYRETRKFSEQGYPIISLDACIKRGNDTICYYDCIADPHASNPEKIIMERQALIDIQEKLDAQPIRYSKEIVKLKFKGYSSKQIQQELNIDERTMNNSLYRMRKLLKTEKYIDEPLNL